MEPPMQRSMRISGLLALGAFLLISCATQASDFSERLVAWNVGPARGTASREVAPAAYVEELPAAAPSDVPASSQPVAPQRQAVAPRSQWQQMAFGPGGSYDQAVGMPAAVDCATCGGNYGGHCGA